MQNVLLQLPIAAMPSNAIVLLPMIAMLIPVIVIVAKSKMRLMEMQILHQQQASQSPVILNEIQALRSEVKELKEIVHAQVMAMDDRQSMYERLQSSPTRSQAIQEEQVEQ